MAALVADLAAVRSRTDCQIRPTGMADLAVLCWPGRAECHENVVQIVRNSDLVVEEVFEPDEVILLGHCDEGQQIAEADADARNRGPIEAVGIPIRAGKQS